MPIVGHRFAGKNRDWIGTQPGVERGHQAEGRDRLFDIGVGAHRNTMNARIGAPGRLDRYAFARYLDNRPFDRALNAWPVRLPLPPHEGAAVKFNSESEAGHESGQ